MNTLLVALVPILFAALLMLAVVQLQYRRKIERLYAIPDAESYLENRRAMRKRHLEKGMRVSLQFTLLLTFAAAILCGMMAPFVRAWDYERQLHFALLVAIAGVTFALVEGFLILMYRRAHRQAGECLVVVPYDFLRFLWPLLALLYFILIALRIVFTSERPIELGYDVCNIVMSTMLFSLYCWSCRLHNSEIIKLCRNGIVINCVRYQPWSRVQINTWDKSIGRIRFTASGGIPVSTLVPAEAREAISLAIGDL